MSSSKQRQKFRSELTEIGAVQPTQDRRVAVEYIFQTHDLHCVVALRSSMESTNGGLVDQNEFNRSVFEQLWKIARGVHWDGRHWCDRSEVPWTTGAWIGM